MTAIALVFPHQLYKDHPVIRKNVKKVLLIEDSLFFGDSRYPLQFHKQKLAYHRATMACFQETLQQAGHTVELIPYQPDNMLETLCLALSVAGARQIVTIQITDFLLAKRLRHAALMAPLELVEVADPGFINTPKENKEWRTNRKHWFMADFYKWQRRKLNILMVDEKPVQGKWSFDKDNRKKMSAREIELLPLLPVINQDATIRAAIKSVESEFPTNPGTLHRWYYPTTHQQAQLWLQDFLEQRFAKFGPYEDAIVAGQPWLHHSLLTPMLNIGLLTPAEVIKQALSYAEKNNTPINSIEGFVRQIIGWREFMRATYIDLGTPMRSTNHWNHHRKLPSSFYSATTGIDPVDDVIIRILDTGYCHHIERLMILGGFMFLCEIHPDDIYRWFMEMFIDSYDWVMVPNVYAMSQHADGGSITTKPYFSGSNYVLKMSNFKKGQWSIIWDGLFWRWIAKHQTELASNPRWAMMVKNVQKMDDQKRQTHLSVAETFLDNLK